MATSDHRAVYVVDWEKRKLVKQNYVTGKVEREIKLTDTALLNAITISPSGDMLAIAEIDMGLTIIEAASLDIIQRKIVAGSVYCVSWSPNGKFIALGLESGEVAIMDAIKFDIAHRDQSHTKAIRTVSISPSSRLLVSGSDDDTATIYTAPDLTVLKTLKGHTHWVLSAIFIGEDKVATGSTDKSIIVWNAVNGNVIHTMDEHDGSVACLALSPDKKYLVSGDLKNKICIYDATTFRFKNAVKVGAAINSLCFANNTSIIYGAHNNEVSAFNIETGLVIKKYGRYGYPSIVLSPSFTVCGTRYIFNLLT